MLHIQPLKDRLTKQTLLVVIPLLKEEIELRGKLQCYLEIGSYQMLSLSYGVDGSFQPRPLRLNPRTVLLEVLVGGLFLDNEL